MISISKPLPKLRHFFTDKRGRYLLVGGINTVFGYSVTVGLYYLLRQHLHIILISLLANMLGITMSFVTYKLFVFKTVGRWWQEYFRAYLVYGAAALGSAGLLWLLVNIAGLPIWLAQGLVTVIIVVASYLGHNFFTFYRKE